MPYIPAEHIIAAALVVFVFFSGFLPRFKVSFSAAALVFLLLISLLVPGSAFPSRFDGDNSVFDAIFGIFAAADWNAVLIFAGTSIIASLLAHSKMPELAAIKIVNEIPKRRFAVVALLIFTALFSAFFDGITCFLALFPVAVAFSRRLKVRPSLLLTMLTLVANVESAATMIAGPQSLLFASSSGISFSDFFIRDGRISIFFIIQIAVIPCCILFAAFLPCGKPDEDAEPMAATTAASPIPAMLAAGLLLSLFVAEILPTKISILQGAMSVFFAAAGLVWFQISRKKNFWQTMKFAAKQDWQTAAFLVALSAFLNSARNARFDVAFANAASSLNLSFIELFFFAFAVSAAFSALGMSVPFLAFFASAAPQISAGNAECLCFAAIAGHCFAANFAPSTCAANSISTSLMKKIGCGIATEDWMKLSIPFSILCCGILLAAAWLLW